MKYLLISSFILTLLISCKEKLASCKNEIYHYDPIRIEQFKFLIEYDTMTSALRMLSKYDITLKFGQYEAFSISGHSNRRKLIYCYAKMDLNGKPLNKENLEIGYFNRDQSLIFTKLPLNNARRNRKKGSIIVDSSKELALVRNPNFKETNYEFGYLRYTSDTNFTLLYKKNALCMGFKEITPDSNLNKNIGEHKYILDDSLVLITNTICDSCQFTLEYKISK